MIKMDLRQLTINLNDPHLSDQLRRLIASDQSFMETVLAHVSHELLMEHHFDIEEGWDQEPDRILVTMPFAVYPERQTNIQQRRAQASNNPPVTSEEGLRE